jgi:hypothetical protein
MLASHHEALCCDGVVSPRSVTAWLSRIAGWCVLGGTLWDQPWTPVVTLPHVRDGRRVLCDGGVADVPQARYLMRNVLLDLPTFVSTTACH